MEVQTGLNKATLMKVVDARNFLMLEASAKIGAVDGYGEATIEARNDGLWITDIIPQLYDAKGHDLLNAPLLDKDNITVSINIGGTDLTTRPVPLAAFATLWDNKDLWNGHLLRPNHKITFRFEAKKFKDTSYSEYPLTASIILKGYELSSTSNL